MARYLRLLLLAVLVLAASCESAVFSPVSESHRSAALELFSLADGSYGSLEETYEALKTFKVLGIEKKHDITTSSCASVAHTLKSTSSASKDYFQALRVNSILKCDLNSEAFRGTESKLKGSLNGANSLIDFYYSIGGLVLLKEQTPEVDVHLGDADRIFRSIKALGQSDGRWRLNSNNPESSNNAAGIALEALAGVISLATPQIDNSLITTLKNDLLKLFDGIERYDDGTYYFDEKHVGALGHQSPISASASVVRGITAVAAVTSENLNLPGDKILGLAKFFLGVGIPGSAQDLYHQIDALSCLENIRESTPLILSLPATVISVTKKDQLKVRVSTVLGSPARTLSVRLMQIFVSGSKDASVIDQKLKFNAVSGMHVLETLPKNIDVGSYVFSFEIIFDNPEHKKAYVTGGRTRVLVDITGVIKIGNAEIVILDGDHGSIETQKKLTLPGGNDVALSANHLQKLRLSFDLTTPSGNAFNPHQAFLKLRHESEVDHIFLVGNSGKKFEIILDFLGLVEKFFYLSGRYDIQLTVGDSDMENSFLQPLGYVELDLPDAPEKAARPPPQPVDPYSRYGPKPEIAHIFRDPEKRPAKELSLVFLGLVLIPFFGFLAGLVQLRANLKNFPKATVPSTFALLFHLGIAAVLALYALFWLKLDLFTTLKALGLLGMFLMFVGHKTLSHLASTSSKLKST
ncbi:dolichyl-diphosphooligosaccharide--protein glycosyltransferase subunit 2-like [Salvia splendens]|uniref:dolichyl-diphosphooligosaccharide--protein glycosyltransferase subunit 2-like n=1 Tax=Salvia splendens TaxID=180675 RepID=UPI001C271597|nr:dolichyl-diphosphooligosaccharide--protein glycosyltransferase subunit 2-like [Salvia splendens]